MAKNKTKPQDLPDMGTPGEVAGDAAVAVAEAPAQADPIGEMVAGLAGELESLKAELAGVEQGLAAIGEPAEVRLELGARKKALHIAHEAARDRMRKEEAELEQQITEARKAEDAASDERGRLIRHRESLLSSIAQRKETLARAVSVKS